MNSEKLEVRRLLRSDIKQIKQIEKDELASELVGEAGVIQLVAEVNDTVMGYLSAEKDGITSELLHVFVDKRYRRKGIGSALLRNLSQKLGPDRSVEVLVPKDDLSTQFFLARNGFRVVRRREFAGYEFYILRKGNRFDISDDLEYRISDGERPSSTSG